MKKWFILLLISFNFIAIQLANATSGRTNSSGCHNSKKVGYHCHGTPKVTTSIPKSTLPFSKNEKTTSDIRTAKKVNKIDYLVQDIQIQLNALGYNVGKADGILGKNTISGIKRFQNDKNISPDGMPTSELLVKLILANS